MAPKLNFGRFDTSARCAIFFAFIFGCLYDVCHFLEPVRVQTYVVADITKGVVFPVRASPKAVITSEAAGRVCLQSIWDSSYFCEYPSTTAELSTYFIGKKVITNQKLNRINTVVWLCTLLAAVAAVLSCALIDAYASPADKAWPWFHDEDW